MVVRVATRTNPRVDLGQLTFPETTELMGGQVFVLNPAVDRVLGDTEVFGDLVDGDPGFSHPSFLPVTEYRPPSGDHEFCGKKNSNHDRCGRQ